MSLRIKSLIASLALVLSLAAFSQAAEAHTLPSSTAVQKARQFASWRASQNGVDGWNVGNCRRLSAHNITCQGVYQYWSQNSTTCQQHGYYWGLFQWEESIVVRYVSSSSYRLYVNGYNSTNQHLVDCSN